MRWWLGAVLLLAACAGGPPKPPDPRVTPEVVAAACANRGFSGGFYCGQAQRDCVRNGYHPALCQAPAPALPPTATTRCAPAGNAVYCTTR